ncbi:hypothetical protein Hypma_000504 [Hypsizygus marmoreus]|uniref:Uncharacterized protein n=1 Tax=Hypsizygus marmoreus TaxID=39966 RepID=A0A369J8D1_HYPMA|nr:hypothetical protein Hypma_000504 [Hypsizygus marmoreus]
MSLVDLTACVLRRYLPKDETLQVSNAWDSTELSEAHVQYAALDVFAAWSIYESLANSPTGEAVTASTAAGTPVKLISRDGNLAVALGYVAPDQPKQFDGVNVSKTRLVINITSVLCSAYLVQGDLLRSRKSTPLGNISSTVPFGLLCAIRDLEVCTHNELSHHETQARSALLPPHPFPSGPSNCSDSLPLPSHSDSIPDSSDNELSRWIEDIAYDPDEEQSCLDAVPDSQSVSKAQALVSDSSLSYRDEHVRSRVLGDHWHLMDQIKISVNHGLRRPFSRALRDALLLPDVEDKAAVEAVLADRNVTWDQMLLWKPRWVWERVKRFAPRPEILHARVSQVYQAFGPLKDATTGQPLFNDASWDKAKNILENIRQGYYSDPIGLDLYMSKGKDHNGLNLYRCIRGTNSVEGGIHQNIAKRFGSYNASPRFAVNLLRDYCLHHNLKVGTFNRTGKLHNSSYDIWTRNRIAKLADLTSDAFPPRSREVSVIGWVNGNDFEQSSETFGILPLSESMKTNLGMADFHHKFAVQEKIRHFHLTAQQETRFAILPVHTPNERALFSLLVKDHEGHFAGRTQPNWVALSRSWSQYCDGHTIFYKLPEHLKNYYKAWKEFRNEDNSIETYRAAYDQIHAYLVPDAARMPRVRAAVPAPLDEEVNVCNRMPQNEPITEWEVGLLLGHQMLQQSTLQFKYVEVPSKLDDRKGKRWAVPEGDPTPKLPVKKHRAKRTLIPPNSVFFQCLSRHH